jgi:hypothetical protein
MLLERLKNEPAVVIGAIAAGILATVQTLAGSGVIGTDVLDTITQALDPTSGWAIPLILGVITRFFVYGPKSAETLLNTPPPTDTNG